MCGAFHLSELILNLTMQWCNEKVMEFLEIYRTEPCLWDPRLKTFKNRGAHYDAWRRIAQALQYPFTIDELKKKKESLMGYYRIHLNKYKKSLKSGAAAANVYTTNWFAFDLMHSFLKPIYDNDTTGNSETSRCTHFEPVSESEASEGHESSCHSDISVTKPNIKSQHRGLPSYVLKRPSNTQATNSTPEEPTCSTKKQRKEISTSTKHFEESFDNTTQQISTMSTQKLDEYDHFAIMIAAKIRKINDMYERERVMNSIQNMVFHSLMKEKHESISDISYTSPGACWDNNADAAVDIDTKTNIPLFLIHSNTLRSCSTSLGSDKTNIENVNT